MATKLPPVPQPLPPEVRRFNTDGRPTVQQVDKDREMTEFLKALVAAVQGT